MGEIRDSAQESEACGGGRSLIDVGSWDTVQREKNSGREKPEALQQEPQERT